MNKPLLSLLVVSGLLALAAPAQADNAQVGMITALLSYTASSDTQTVDGSVTVQAINGVYSSFAWGGTSCSQYATLSSAQVQLFSLALVHQRQVVIKYKSASINCVVGFNIN